MDIDFSVDGEVRVTMMDYLNKVVSEFPDTIQGIVTTPAADHLFIVRRDTDRKLLEDDRATAFHISVSQLVFTNPCVSKDIQTSVEFLTTRVLRTDKDYWCKLQRVLK